MRSYVLALSAALLAAALVSACSSYRIEPPTTPDGIACAKVCDNTWNACVSLAESLADFDRRACETGIDTEVERCQRHASDDKARQACEGRRGSCATSANTGKCSSEHGMCVLRCGGREVMR